MAAIRKWLRLRRREKILFLGACLVLVAARTTLKLIPFRRLRHWAEGNERPPAAAEAGDVRRAVAQAAARIPGSTCLTRALAGAALLRWSGLPSRLAIGVRKPGGEFAAHAWVVSGSEIVTGDLPDLASFTELPSPADG